MPSKLITCDDGDPPWMNEVVKNKIKWKNKIYKDFIKNETIETSYFKLQISINTFSETVDKRKNGYNSHLVSILNNPKTSPKTYWPILKSFYSGKKIPLIPPFLHNDKLIFDIK